MIYIKLSVNIKFSIHIFFIITAKTLKRLISQVNHGSLFFSSLNDFRIRKGVDAMNPVNIYKETNGAITFKAKDSIS